MSDFTEDPAGVPNWLVAADNHNLGNTNGGSILDPSTWETKFSNAGKFIATSLLSGVNSFYNTGVAIGRFTGIAQDAQENDTGEWISSLDDDLGAYYKNNSAAVDLAGFIATSIIPGIGGIKILNAGQRALGVAAKSGKIGANLSRGTGLLVPKTELYIAQSAKDITQNLNIFNGINANGVKALASGVWQNTLEGVAFETAVQASMFRSPILDQQDMGDIVKNIAVGGLVNGVIGGALTGAVSYGTIKKAVIEEQKKLLPLSSRTLLAEKTAASSKVVLMADDLENAVAPLRVGTDESNIPAATKLFTDKQTRIQNDIRANINKMAGSDNELGNLVADGQYGSGAQNTLETFLHTNEIGRVNEVLDTEKLIKSNLKNGIEDTSLGVKYIKLHGEDAGAVSEGRPTVLSLADTVLPTKNQTTQDAVLAKVRNYKFKLSDGFSLDGPFKDTTHLEAEGRYLWARYLLKDIPDDTAVHFTDLPVLERAYKDGKLGIKLKDNSGNILVDGFDSSKEMFDYLVKTKDSLANTLLLKQIKSGERALEFSTEAIAKTVNTKLSRLEGTTLNTASRDYFAMQDAHNQYGLYKLGKKLVTPTTEIPDPAFLPQYAKIGSKIPQGAMDLDGNILDGMVYLKEQQKQFQQAAANVTAKNLGELDALVPTITEKDLMGANTTGSGASLFGFENSGYGTLGSKVAAIGAVTRQAKVAARENTTKTLTAVLSQLGNKQEAAIEHAALNQRITRSADSWVLDSENSQFVRKSAADDAAKAGDKFEDYEKDDVIPIQHSETLDAISAEIELTSARNAAHAEINSSLGHSSNQYGDVYRPIRPSLTDYPYFAFVKDDKVTGSGHTTLLHAASEGKLNELINSVKLKSPDLRVITKTETEDYFKARGEYEYQRTLNENYLNSELKNKGVFSEFYTKTDPQKIVNDILQQHLRSDDVLVTELMRLKNQPAFDWLEDQGKQFSRVESSRFGSSLSRIEKEGKNPYTDYIKTALDVSKASEYGLLYSFNKALDKAVSVVVGKVRDVSANAKSTEDMLKINEILQANGMDSAYRNAATDLLVNHTAPKGELTKFIRTANGFISRLTLGLDPLNAVNNLIGANVLRGTELTQLVRAINSGDNEIAGQLAAISRVQVPGTGDSILAPTKLAATAIKNFFSDDGTLISQYKAAGYIKDVSAQLKSIFDDFTLKGTETVPDLNGRLARAFQKASDIGAVGEKVSGNRIGEEFNRFLSADVMRQITDIAQRKGILSSDEAHSYINTFVNRVEGNTIASQRPIVFQGPIGQAIGLFQSYQFNLMQQLFRYVAEGTGKDTAMLLGLQGTFYGLQGLPAFQFINQHIIGTASGNKEHRDAYDAVLGIAGKQAGEFLLYGAPSNILQTNLYSRGDINPRQVTVLPSSLDEIPIVGALGKFFGSVKATVSKIGSGTPVWPAMLNGLEHNGLSRPMSGVAQVLQGYSTSNGGNILMQNDLASWATATRIAGGRPLDEAVLNDAVYRIHSYNLYDRAKMNNLAEAVKSAYLGGGVPDSDSITRFASLYAESGGKQVNFNRWVMNQYKHASTSEAQKLAGQLNNPLGKKVQILMGGSED